MGFRRTGADARELAREFPGAARRADFANYGFTLFPGYIDFLRERGVCWVVTGSTQSGRSFNNPRRVPPARRPRGAAGRPVQAIPDATVLAPA